MRITAVHIENFKDVSALLNWMQAVVLFGRNDAGKSNILEALVWAGGGGLGRTDPRLDPGDPQVTCLIELDLVDPESDDADLLAALLQTRHVPPLFPYLLPNEQPPEPDLEAEQWGLGYLSQFPASTLAWDFDSDAKADRFKVGCVGPIYSPGDPVNTVGTLEQVCEALRKRANRHAAIALAAVGTKRAADLFGTLLDRCLASRWMLCTADSGPIWLAPPPEDCTDDDTEAATGLVSMFGEERIPILDRFARALVAHGSTMGAFMSIPDTHRFRPWDVVTVSATPERLDQLAREVEAFVRSHLDFVFEVSGNQADAWLAREDPHVISAAVGEVCDLLSEHATALAPPFVTRDYDVRVDPLSFEHWFSYGDRRLRLALIRRADEASFDLAIAGSGLAIWSAFAIEEAVRQVDRQLDQRLYEYLAFDDEGDDDGAPQQESALGAQPRLYVFDEPERHLHPRAQEQAARWLARRIDEETHILLATHSLPFLSLPAPDVEYALVTRGSDGVTRAESMTVDVWGVLDRRANEAGLGSRAQLLQLARSFLIVEGAHDEAVLRHFYGDQLDRERIVVLAMHGAKKVPALIDAQLLARVDVPLIILFDDIRAAALTAPAEPSRRDVALHQLWHLQQNWPPERRAPHVVSFAVPDIYCSLPDECVARVVADHGGSFLGWEKVIDRFRADSRGMGFKPFFLSTSSLPRETDTDDLLREILDRCRQEPREPLRTAFAEVRERAVVDH